jgi:hypothetical protein
MSEPGHLADAVLDGLLAGDPALLRTRLHPRVHLRMLQPGITVARVGAHPVAAGWGPGLVEGGSPLDVRVLDRSSWRCAGRLGLHIRLAVGPDGRECEQLMYIDVADGLVHRIDVLASGLLTV